MEVGTMSTDSGVEKILRRRYDQVVLSTNGKATKKFHLPSDNGTTAPRCGRDIRSKGWRLKDLAVYPPGWHSVCSDCADELPGNPGPAPSMDAGAASSDWAT